MRDDTTYFYARAETELELAQRATHPDAVRAHYIIANHYLDRCYGGDAAVTGGADDGGPAPETEDEDAGKQRKKLNQPD
jgi:hypothetical protein